MKQNLLLLWSLFIFGFFGHTNLIAGINSNQDDSIFPLEINTFTFDQLFEAGGGGCGMTLWEPKASPREDGALFFHGLGDDFSAIMVFDGEIINLTRINASGQEFYGQQTNQTFITEDGSITVQVNVTLGAPGEIESLSIPDGTITVTTQGKTKDIPISGDAGC